MTRLYLDTEFNGFGGALISLALVCADGREFYEVRRFPSPADYRAEDGPYQTAPLWHPFVAEMVIPKLGKEAIPFPEFRGRLHAFLLQFDDPEIICDWHDDAMHFCQMLKGPTYELSLDYQCRIAILRTPPGEPLSAKPHNALADALALMEWHQAKMVA